MPSRLPALSFQFFCKENEVKVIECNPRASWVTPSFEDLAIAGVGELVVVPPETSDLSTVWLALRPSARPFMQ